jgi:hypothetical protein
VSSRQQPRLRIPPASLSTKMHTGLSWGVQLSTSLGLQNREQDTMFPTLRHKELAGWRSVRHKCRLRTALKTIPASAYVRKQPPAFGGIPYISLSADLNRDQVALLGMWISEQPALDDRLRKCRLPRPFVRNNFHDSPTQQRHLGMQRVEVHTVC